MAFTKIENGPTITQSTFESIWQKYFIMMRVAVIIYNSAFPFFICRSSSGPV